MATLRDIRNRISGVTSIGKITSAMKMVSSIKSRRAQRQVESARPYYQSIENMLSFLASLEEVTGYDNQLFHSRNLTVKNVATIVIAGDKGMCGSFNNNLFKVVDTHLGEEFNNTYPNAEPHLILFGTKAVDYYRKRNYHILAEFPSAFQTLQFSVIDNIRSYFFDDFIAGDIDVVELYFNRFVNLMKQEPTSFQLLPITFDKSKLSEVKPEFFTDFIYEPSKEVVLDTLITQYLDLNIWGPILESNAAEQSARLLAMDKATQNAEDLIKELELQYNNARQAAITTEMLEIVGGADALKK